MSKNQCISGIKENCLSLFDTSIAPDVTEVLLHLSEQPDLLLEANLAVLERLVILMYSKTCDVLKVNGAMQIIFSQGSRNIENIAPTEAVLIDHIVQKRAQHTRLVTAGLSPH